MKHRRLTIQLTKTKRDQVISAWLDTVQSDPDVNVSEIIRAHLYTVATRQTSDPAIRAIREAIAAEFAKLPSMIMLSGDSSSAESGDDADEIARRLGAMPD